jgi:hypothetical protein
MLLNNNFKKMSPEISPNVNPPEVAPAKPEKKVEVEKNIPFHTPPEAKPFHETKTYPDKKEIKQ